MTLKSFAKLNLFLAVLNKRKDNFHNIETLFERIDLSDKIILTSRRDKNIRITCANPAVPKDNSNLAYRSAKLLQDNFGIEKGLNIKIIKNIPVGAGLGGGSSNAAAVLIGLNKSWKLGLGINKLANLAAKLGSDVPFFIYNSRFAEGAGRGEMIKPLKRLDKTAFWHVLAVPRIKVPTPLIYKRYDTSAKKGKICKKVRLTKPAYNVKLLTLALEKRDFYLIGEAMFNGLETVTCGLYPEVTRIKERFSGLGAKSILMSGSGPAVFGIIPSRKEAVSLAAQLREENKSWRVFVSKTI